MRLFFRIYAKPAALLTLVLSFMLAAAIPLLASDVSGALYRADVKVTNSSYTATRVSVPFTLNTQALLDGYYIDPDFSNVSLLSPTGSDIPFMPAVGSGDKWMMFPGQVGQNTSQNYLLYTGGPDMGSNIYYFPGDGGMATSDSASLELGDTFEIEIDGYIDTSSGSDKNLVSKEDAFVTLVSGSDEITSAILTSVWTTPTGHDDPDTDWSSEDNAYDDNTTSKTTSDIPLLSWSGYLELTHASVSTNKIRYWVTRESTQINLIDVDVYYDAAWNDVYEGAPTVGAWVTHYLDTDHDVTSVRIRFYNSRETSPRMAYINEVDYGATAYDISVVATGVSSGEHVIKVTADATDLKIYIDDVEEDSVALSGTSVLDNSNDWTFLTNYSMPYMNYLKITIDGTLQQHIIWQNSTTFTDQSGNGHDATPTFRTSSTDPDVTAVIKNFNAVTQAAFSSGTDDDIPEMVLAPEESIDLHRRMENTDQLPGGEWVNSFMDDNGWPRELFWFTFVFGIAVLLTNVAFRFTKDLFPTALAPAIWVILFASSGVVPWAALWPCAVVSIGEIIRRRVVAIG